MKTPDLEYLKTLIAVAESRNFYEAASRLGITQPSVSLKMKELQAQLSLPVFQLEGKRKVLTHYGRSLYEVAKLHSNELEKNIENLHRHYASPELLTLRVGGRTEVLDFIAPLLDFSGKIELISLSSAQAVQKLLSHEIDVAISYTQPDSTEVISKKIFQSSSHFVCHKKFLNKKGTIALAKDYEFLTNTPCILYLQDGHMLKDWLNHLNVPIENLKVRYVAEDWRTVQNLVDRGMGFALVPEYIKSFSNEVSSLELPTQIMPKYIFYALYEKGLKKIEPFKKVLSFEWLEKNKQPR